TENEIRFQVALLAAVPALIASFIARFLFDAPLAPELLAQFIFAVAPMWMVEIAVGMLGPFAKHLAFLGCTVIYLIALMAAAIAYLRYVPRKDTAFARFASPIAFALSIWAVTVVVFLPAVGGGIFGSHLRQGALSTFISLLLVHSVYGLALGLAAMRYIDRPVSVRASATIISRRRLVRGVWYAVLAVGIYDIGKSLLGSWLQSGSGRVKGGDGVFPNIDNLALEITPTRDFYQVSKNAFDPQVDVRSWKLEVAGLVHNTLSLTYEEMKALPSVEQYATLACISNEVGGDLIGTALWRGVRLRDVLENAALKQGVIDIVVRASDDYTDSVPLDRAMADGTLLVYEMNGEPLTPEHGSPVRLLVPGIYGMKNVKWITRIEAVDFDFKGYWQRRGWDDRAEYKTMSRIDAPDGSVKGEATIAGIAFAGDRGISKVEVSTDGGASWEQAEIKPALSQISWVLWQRRWRPAQTGRHKAMVRATDGRGQKQTSQYAPPAPSGSSGYHSVTVRSE
ncbi:MAG TPA: molybdopterin-dependent oxidoreductase, partial [Blastocatellia bacterium]|nr:molybdopterin-dependent oxidoreductase [Blastocatellia bacterium]